LRRVFARGGESPYFCQKPVKLEHVGIAVKDLATAVPLYTQLLNSPCYKTEEVAAENVITAFFLSGESKIELLQSTDPEGVIAKFIEKRGEGLHHLAFDVPDIVAEMDRLRAAGFQLLSDTPRRGADNKLVCFLHPKTTGGVLIEICQDTHL